MGHKPFKVNPSCSKNTPALLRSATASRRAVLRMNRSVYWNIIVAVLRKNGGEENIWS
jgi:hypothetical protein